jgi:hypothetical protein
MAWVIDTCLLIDVAEADPAFGIKSASLIDLKRTEGLIVCPITYTEPAPVFHGDPNAQNEFLLNIGAAWPEAWTHADTLAAHEAWYRYVAAKRAGKSPKRPVADVLIGAFASRFDGLLTRNETDFSTVFPNLKLVSP